MEHDFASETLQKEATRIDRWIKYVATRSWIKRGVFIVAFLETTVSPLLPELVVAAVLSYRKDISWKLLSVISALGSTLGAGVLYFLGKYLYKTYEIFFEKWLGTSLGSYAEQLFAHNTFVSLFLAAFTPLPDRIFAFLSGVFILSLPVVLVAFFLGRLIRVGIVAYFSYHFGNEARSYILKHTKRVTVIILAIIALYVFLHVRGIL
jgi:membrane protein YqaA with SNARE-associated domain